MKKGKILGLLLLAAFIFTMGFNKPAFAATPNVKLSKKLDAIKAQIKTHDGDMATDIAAEYNGLLTKLNEIQALIQTHYDILGDIDAATSESCPDSWKKVLPAADRFEVVMNGEAVLDKETCLVWERAPGATTMDWNGAIAHCYQNTVGGRKGWRLPTIEELASLVDPTQSNPALPAGHPFLNVQSAWYWSATTNAGSAVLAWFVGFDFGAVGSFSALSPTATAMFGACEVDMGMMLIDLVI